MGSNDFNFCVLTISSIASQRSYNTFYFFQIFGTCHFGKFKVKLEVISIIQTNWKLHFSGYTHRYQQLRDVSMKMSNLQVEIWQFQRVQRLSLAPLKYTDSHLSFPIPKSLIPTTFCPNAPSSDTTTATFRFRRGLEAASVANTLCSS